MSLSRPTIPPGLLLATAIALVAASPAAAEEEPLVPPGNSAVNQYTEGFPTAGGEKEAHNQGGRNVSPGNVLGAKNASRLEKQGPAGHAAAELAAETAPNAIAAGPSAGNPRGSGIAAGAPSGSGGEPSGRGAATAPSPPSAPSPAAATQANGSSGLSEVLSRATGSSSEGGMGLFLPLLILAAIAWALAYLARQRRPVS